MANKIIPYTGRFAPSPTGPLHFGSLVTALGSLLDARSRGGRWLLRMEDLDPPREVPGAADLILRTLDACGLRWDGEVLYQSRRHEAYREALERLENADAIYPCACTRREIADSGILGIDGPVYPGTCRNGRTTGGRPQAVRVRTHDDPIAFTDRIQGRHVRFLATEIGDFIVRRANGLFAYQLAVVVDDAFQGITHVVRGADLLDSTPRQIHLQSVLGLPVPEYAHLPVVVDAAGQKLSKQTGAQPVSPSTAGPALVSALDCLGQAPPRDLERAGVEAILGWAHAHWNPGTVPRVRSIPLPAE